MHSSFEKKFLSNAKPKVRIFKMDIKTCTSSGNGSSKTLIWVFVCTRAPYTYRLSQRKPIPLYVVMLKIEKILLGMSIRLRVVFTPLHKTISWGGNSTIYETNPYKAVSPLLKSVHLIKIIVMLRGFWDWSV